MWLAPYLSILLKAKKCHVTLWLTPTLPLGFLVTLSRPPTPPGCHVLFEWSLMLFNKAKVDIAFSQHYKNSNKQNVVSVRQCNFFAKVIGIIQVVKLYDLLNITYN